LVALESAAIDAEFQLQEPGLTSDRVKEPAIALPRRTDLDDASLAPISLGEFAKIVNAIDNPLQDVSVPATRLARPSDAFPRMPAPPVRLPRHARRAPNFGDVQITFALFFHRRRIVRFPLDRWTSGQD